MNVGLSPYKYAGTVFFGKSGQVNATAKQQMPKCCCSCSGCQVLDIHSNAVYPLNVLSNFTKSCFTVDGVKVRSMEGFLQSLKTPCIEEQEEICDLIGFTAKKIGNQIAKKHEFDGRTLYWQGKKIDRYSQEYQNLLKKAYLSKYKSDLEFRSALACTKGRELVHTVGKQDPKETILTEKEFVGILTAMRDGEFEHQECNSNYYHWTHIRRSHLQSCKYSP